MDVSYVNPFIAATRETFATMMGIQLEMGAPSVGVVAHFTYDISGVIGLSGQAQGIIALSFPQKVALTMISNLIGVEVTEVGPELTDGVGELVNIVAGNAKKGLSQYGLSISLPNVIIGEGHRVIPPTNSPSIVVPFSSPLGEFSMEVSLRS